MEFDKLLHEELIIKPLKAKTRDEALTQLANRLQEEGYVKSTYLQGIINREKQFPTGLPVGAINPAIPHTDAEHVIEPAIAVGILEEPVQFANMANPEELLNVSLIFMLALNEPHGQVQFLQKLMSLFQDETLLHSMVKAPDSTQVYALLAPVLGS